MLSQIETFLSIQKHVKLPPIVTNFPATYGLTKILLYLDHVYSARLYHMIGYANF